MVEVTLAIGFVGVGLISIISLFGSLIASSSDSEYRREAITSLNSAQNYIIHKQEFSTLYQELLQDKKVELVFLQFRGNDGENPDLQGEEIYSHWARWDSDWQNTHEPARNGFLYQGVLEIDSKLNPVGTEDLPADPNTYPHGYLALKLSLYHGSSAPEATLENQRPISVSSFVKPR